MQKLKFLVIWKEQVVLVVGAASSRDHLISRLEAAPTGFFFGNLDFPDKRLKTYVASIVWDFEFRSLLFV
jgi:hypothetical protein